MKEPIQHGADRGGVYRSLPKILFALNLGKSATERELFLNTVDPGERHRCVLACTLLL